MSHEDFVFRIGGEAGFGILSSGNVFAKTCSRSGYYIAGLNEYPSLIRGGHNTFTLQVSTEPLFSVKQSVDLLVALNEDAIRLHTQELSQGAIVIINQDRVGNEVEIPKGVFACRIPLITLAKESGGTDLMQNSVSLGAAIYFLDGDVEILKKVAGEAFGSAMGANVKAVEAGFEYAKKNFPQKSEFKLTARKLKEPLMVITGNEAIALGAVKAGCRFFVAYPMTPISSLINFFIKRGPELGILYKQPEDEIAAVTMAIGASYAGVRAMTGSSGGGFSLMVESYGLAGMTETPLVIIEGQRPGPATGLPTWGGQGDLRFVMHAAQDEFLRIVLAPGDPEECFRLTGEAFNLAEKYQTPVVVMTDKHLAEGLFTVPQFDESQITIDRGHLLSEEEQQKPFLRYQVTKSGISPRGIPGRPGTTFIVNSDEHNEEGFSDESSANRIAQMEKRMRKEEMLQKEIPDPTVYGDKEALITLIGWGSTKGPVLDALKILDERGIKAKFLHLTYLNPLPLEFLEKFFKDIDPHKTLLLEQNYTSQLGGWIREKVGFEAGHRFLKYDGRIFYPEEIIERINQM